MILIAVPERLRERAARLRLLTKAGPYIGPRGGKWADAAHTIPWTADSGGTRTVDTKALLRDSLGIARIDMPQIKSTLVPEFIEELRADGVSVQRTRRKVGTIKATQNELHADKVQSMMDNPEVRANLAKPVIVSSDGYLLDGHHRWAALRTMDPQSPIPAVRVGLPMRELLDRAREFKKVEFKKAGGPYIGPRGGKWADPQHTISWSRESQAGGRVVAVRPSAKPSVGPLAAAVAEQVAAYGGKIVAHRTDPSLAVIKLPQAQAGALLVLRDQLGVTAEPVVGGQYVLLSVPRTSVQVPEANDVAMVVNQIVAQQMSLDVVPHKSDPGLVMLRVPKGESAALLALAGALQIDPGQIVVGGKRAMMPVTKPQAKLIASAMAPALAAAPKAPEAPEAPEAPKTTKAPKVPKVPKVPEASPAAATSIVAPSAEMPPYVYDAQWQPPASVGEAVAWCEGLGIAAQFPDLATAQTVCDALRRQHPAVLAHVQFIGTGSQLQKWAKGSPDILAEAKAGKHGIDISAHSPLGGGAIAVAHPIGGKPYRQSAVVFLDSWWSAKHAAKYGAEEDAAFSTSSGAKSLHETLREVAVHELGHVEGFVLRHLQAPGADTTAWEVWKAHCVPQLKQHKAEMAKAISSYGTTNPHECWAEIAVMRRRGDPLPQWVHDAVAAMGIDTHDWAGLSTGWQWGQ